MTNAVPLRIRNTLTNVEHGYFNDSQANALYLDGKVTYYGAAAAETYVRGAHFRGGIEVESNKAITLRIPYETWIEDEPIVLNARFNIDHSAVLNIASTNNQWTEIHPYKCTVRCWNDGVLVPGKPLYMAENNTWYGGNPKLDLNGYNQSVSRLYVGFNPATYPAYDATLKSAEPAMLEVKAETANNDTLPLIVQGQAGLRFDAPGSIAFTNRLSTTTGTLEVRKGTVKFLAGSGWTAVTNIVLAGGTIAVGKGAGAKAFGVGQDLSEAAVSRGAGVFDIAEGERATVRTMNYVDEQGKDRCQQPGVYYAKDSSAAVSASYKVDWVTGAGALRVLRSAIPSGTIMLVR